MATSEQREGALSAGVSLDENNAVDACAGWRVELLPGAPQDVADHLIENIKKAAATSSTSLLKEGNTCEAILRVLLDGMDADYDFEVRRPQFKCTCDISRVYRTLALLPRHEVDEILERTRKSRRSASSARGPGRPRRDPGEARAWRVATDCLCDFRPTVDPMSRRWRCCRVVGTASRPGQNTTKPAHAIDERPRALCDHTPARAAKFTGSAQSDLRETSRWP